MVQNDKYKGDNIREILAVFLYIVGIVLAELLLGNPEFSPDIWIWHFTMINPILWSFPVHAVGGFIILFFNVSKTKNKLKLTIVLPTVYFLAMESINVFFLKLFIYRELPFIGWIGGFLLVIVLYLVLCTLISIILYGNFDSILPFFRKKFNIKNQTKPPGNSKTI